VTNTSGDPVILAFDTSAAHCAAALLRGETVIATISEEMGRGQAERLIPLLDMLLQDAGLSWRDLTALAVGVGPGNFTGIRISVSAARGLALALDIPAIGVSTFAAISQGVEAPHLAAVPAPQGNVYIAPDGQAPALVAMAEAQDNGLPLAFPPAPPDLTVAMAQVARAVLRAGGPFSAPAPLYIRPADAAPARDTAPLILTDDAG